MAISIILKMHLSKITQEKITLTDISCYKRRYQQHIKYMNQSEKSALTRISFGCSPSAILTIHKNLLISSPEYPITPPNITNT